MPSKKADFEVIGGPSVYLLRPMNDGARSWAEEHLPEDRTTWGGAIAVEHRYIDDIVAGIRGDGMTVV
jgi:hypothetical protein